MTGVVLALGAFLEQLASRTTFLAAYEVASAVLLLLLLTVLALLIRGRPALRIHLEGERAPERPRPPARAGAPAPVAVPRRAWRRLAHAHRA